MQMSQQIVVSGVGVWHPESSITNQELVDSYNAYVDSYNEAHKAEIEAQQVTAKPYSSAEFIEKALDDKNELLVAEAQQLK